MQKIHTVRFYLLQILENTNESIVMESRSVVAQSQGWRRGWIEKKRKEIWVADGNVLCLGCGIGFIGYIIHWFYGCIYLSKLIKI